jgi:hypothetical protein
LGEGSEPEKNKLDEAKKELKGFISLNGFSTVFNTSNPFVKTLWVFFFLVLFSGCIQNVYENMSDYYEYTVITKIEYVNENPMKLPAITLCLASLGSNSISTNVTLEKSFVNCTIGGVECDIKDFYSFATRTSYMNDIIQCHVLNGGRNSSGHPNKIISTRNTGFSSGFYLQFYLPKNHILYYYINDAYLKPTTFEINKYFTRGIAYDYVLEKSVETKLELPFNDCWNRINLPDSPLVRQLSAANITYRQVNCFELCFEKFVQKYAFENRLSEDEARTKDEARNFEREKNCDDLCPTECESTQYKITGSMLSLTDYIEYSLPMIPVVGKKLNTTIYSTEEFNRNYMEIGVYFDSLKYTKISQTPKTSLSGLVSNLGGSFGLFLDLSFLSACRAIEFLLGIIFKL